MKKILYIGDGATLSHVLRPLELAERFYDEHKQHIDKIEVHFACDIKYRSFITNKEFIFHEITSMDSEVFLESLRLGENVFTYEYLSDCLREDEEIINLIKPNIIYSDFRFSMYICAYYHKIQYYCITNAYWSIYSLIERPLLGTIDISSASMYSRKRLEKNYSRYVSKFLRDYNFLRRERNMSVVESIEEMYCAGDFVLYADLPEFAPVSELRSNESYIGPVTGKIKSFLNIETEEAVEKIKHIKNNSDSFVVYLSLGSSGNNEVLENCLKVLDKINAKVFLTTAGKVVGKTPQNVYKYNYLYADTVLPFIDLAITNGGSGSNYQMYEHNVELIALPDNVDQFLSSSMIERLHLGTVIWPDKASDYNILLDTILKIIK
jgi:UDP:flavonoid glycosyltransferase YjiC (YdhE family)